MERDGKMTQEARLGQSPTFLRAIAKRLLPRAALNRLYFRLAAGDEKDFIVLNTIPKSGTNYFRILVGNYLNVLYENRDTPTGYKEVHTTMFPNERSEYTRFFAYRRPHPIMTKTPFKDFVYSHGTDFLTLSKGRVVFIYRNPLDYVVSRFYYNWKYREDRKDVYQHPREIIDYALDPYIEQFTLMSGLAKSRSNILATSYESLTSCPIAVFGMIVGWLGLPVHYGAIRKAVEFSSIDQVRKEEEAGGPIHAPETGNFEGFFTRSGKIGQWRDYFTDEDVQTIADKLGRHGILLDQFILDPFQPGE